MQNMDSLETELKICQTEANDLLKWKIKKLVFVKGNHEEFISRWLEDARYIEQPHNHRLGVKLADAMFDGHDPFAFALTKLYPLKDLDRVEFLGIDDSFMPQGIENAAHGHLGANGSRNPNLLALEKCYGAGNFGHTHSAGILRNMWRVGTFSYLKMDYNRGPSSWTQTLLIQYKNGSRQLINNINGKFKN